MIFKAIRITGMIVFACWALSSAARALPSMWQRLLLSIVGLLGIYLWRSRPEQGQAGLVFVLFGLPVLAPVTI
jgi:hypothetical protein